MRALLMNAEADQFIVRRIRWTLALGTIALYAWSVLANDFIGFDDSDYVVSNPHVRGGLSLENIFWAFTAFHSGNWHPITWISHMLDCTVFGTEPAGHHLTNVIIHAASTVLLFDVLRRMTGGMWRSALVAALFAWHPLHVESVAWVAERKDVLCAFFGILSLRAWWNFVSAPRDGRPIANSHYRWALIWFTVGLMSKPMLVTLPCVLLLLDFWPLRRFSNPWAQCSPAAPGQPVLTQFSLRQLVVEKLLFFVPTFISSVLTFLAQRSAGAVANTQEISMGERLPHMALAYGRYLLKAIYPSKLAIFYPLVRPFPTLSVIIAIMVLAAISFLALKLVRQRPYLLVGWLWFLGMLIPTIGVVQVGAQDIADRYTYLPLIGFFIMIAWSLRDLVIRWPETKSGVIAATCLALAACMTDTWIQARYWSGTLTLFRHAEAVAPVNEVVETILGSAYADLNRLPEAREHAEAALRLDPNKSEIIYLMGKILAYEGKDDEALRNFEQTIKLRPHNAVAQYSLANLLASRNQLSEATNHYALALREQPEIPALEYNYGVVLVRLADREPTSQGKGILLREAESHLKAALRLRPDYPEVMDQLAAVETRFGETDGAIARYQQAIAIDPNYAHARLKLGFLLASQKKYEDAKVQLLEAIRIEPTNFLAYFNLACTLEAENQLPQAATAFSEAARLDPVDSETQSRLAGILTTLGKPEAADALRKSAGLLARDGHFPESIDALRKALKMKPDSPEILANLAWLLATCSRDDLRNGAEAVTLAERACELGGRKDARFLMSLDAALAEAGRFPAAVKAAIDTAAAATAANQTPLAEAAAKRIELYRAGHPFHQSPARARPDSPAAK